ncbi:nucleoside kinase [bacterium]|nr:nucleoside kinase [bacterium]
MSSTINIKCINNASKKSYPRGIKISEVAKDQNIQLQSPILGALVNNKVEDLSYEAYHPKTVQFIDISHPHGMRMYIRSLSFLLNIAIEELFPGMQLRVEHSVSKGLFCEFYNSPRDISIQDIFELGQKMREIVSEDIPFARISDETEEVIKLFQNKGYNDKVGLLKNRGKFYSSYYKVKNHIDTYYGYLVPSTGYLKVFDLNKYFDGALLQIPQATKPNELAELVLQNKLYDVFKEYSDWSKVLGLTNVNHLNEAHSNGKAETLIKVSEAFHEKKVAQVADLIQARKQNTKIILISGPSSSGKTTFSKRLSIQLMVAGIKPITLSLDNYFVNRDKTPLDENGEFDFETIDALDVEQFNIDLSRLFAGEEVEVPKFSFETGERYYDGEILKLEPNQTLVVEGIHGLNPKLTHLIDDSLKFKVYVSALTSINIDNHSRIPTTDNRLIRRIVRDYRYRNYSAMDTISRWPSVRRGEEKHIFPYQEEADIMFNSALHYELAVLKPYVEPILLGVKNNCPEYSEAKRLLTFFSFFNAITEEGIPPTSIVREFLGGSSFKY